jgi:hypothetical protein
VYVHNTLQRYEIARKQPNFDLFFHEKSPAFPCQEAGLCLLSVIPLVANQIDLLGNSN